MLFIFSLQSVNDFIRTFGNFSYTDNPKISTNVFVVPDMAESTTIFCSPSVINLATSFILCAEPTEVPPKL